jgi:hypothetical protein
MKAFEAHNADHARARIALLKSERKQLLHAYRQIIERADDA